MPDAARPLRKHLEELRWRLMIVVITVVIGAGVSVVYFKPLVEILIKPAEGYLSATGGPIYTEVTELLGVTVKVAMLGGLILSLPILTYQIVAFAAPGLTRREKGYLLFMVPGALVSFAIGAAFAYFVLLPPMLKFLLTYANDIAVPMIRISTYINLVVMLIFWMGLIFETPLIMFTAAKAGVVGADTMAKGRRIIIVVAFFLGAVITPTFDPVNQAMVAIPFLVLYEIGLRLARFARPREVPKEASDSVSS